MSVFPTGLILMRDGGNLIVIDEDGICWLTFENAQPLDKYLGVVYAACLALGVTEGSWADDETYTLDQMLVAWEVMQSVV